MAKKNRKQKNIVKIESTNEFTNSLMCIIQEHLPVIRMYNPHLYQIMLSSIDLAILSMSKGNILNNQSDQQNNQMQQPKLNLNEETKTEIDDIIKQVQLEG